jgi:hypothetical protein
MAYRLHRDENHDEEAMRYLAEASIQGHPVAIQKFAVLHIVGRFGLAGIPRGLMMYFGNIPRLFRYAKDNLP